MPSSSPERAQPDKANSEAVVTAKVEKLVYGGEGLARVNGQVLLTPFVLPGEQIETAATRVKAGLLRGISPTVSEPSPHRVHPLCEYFGVCGGCQYQHANYAYQLEQKIEVLNETLKRLGGIVFEEPVSAISGDPWHYRNRVQLHFDHRTSGFHIAGSQRLCAIDHCYISSPTLNTAIHTLQSAVKEPQWPTFLRSLELFTNEEQLQLTVLDTTRPIAARFFEWCGTILPGNAPGAIQYQAAGVSFRVSRGSFFQVNRFLVDQLVSEALRDFSGSYAVDLYAGVGLFSVPLAKRFKRVDAIERGGPAFRDLEWNAGQNSLPLRTLQSPAEDYLRNLAETPDLVIADPPRAGLGQEGTGELLRILPARLTIISCDPSTLARDLKPLLTAYRIERLTLVDLFPQTYHFETIAHLVRI